MKTINDYVNNIVKTISNFNWKVENVWVENNCIFAELQNGDTEALYAGTEDNPQNVYDVCNRLKYVMNFNNMLNNDDIMI